MSEVQIPPPLRSGLEVRVVGCSGSIPGPDSPASCYLVQAFDGRRTYSIVLDLGGGSLGPLRRWVEPLHVDAVLLSHLHPDHCLDLTGLYVEHRHRPWFDDPTARRRIPVHAPTGAAERMGRAYGVLEPADLTDAFAFESLADRSSFRVGPMLITPIAVEHPVPAFGFRVEAAGAVLAYTGDTDDCPALDDLMVDADLVLADCAFVDGRDEQRGVHLTGSRAARAAARAGGVGALVLTHLPPWNEPAVCRADAARSWDGALDVAEPGRLWQLPGS